jgi:hypothetical protein
VRFETEAVLIETDFHRIPFHQGARGEYDALEEVSLSAQDALTFGRSGQSNQEGYMSRDGYLINPRGGFEKSWWRNLFEIVFITPAIVLLVAAVYLWTVIFPQKIEG